MAANLPQAMAIAQIRDENARTKTFVLDGRLEAAPGQFVMAWLPGVDEKPFSLAQADPVTLTVAAVGPFSRALHSLAVGDRLWLRGPLGHGFTLPERGSSSVSVSRPHPERGSSSASVSRPYTERGSSSASVSRPHPERGSRSGSVSRPHTERGSSSASVSRPHALLLGGGYGVAPLRFLAERLLATGHAVSMIIGARSAAELLLVDAFTAMEVRLWLATEDGSAGLRGLATDVIAPALAAAPAETAMVYACGPTGMLRALAAICQARELPVQLSWEAPMRCGIGLCSSCEVGDGWLTCLDGPVFGFDPSR